METFGLIMCFVIFAGLQHLANWLFRVSLKLDSDDFMIPRVGSIVCTYLSIVIAFSIVKYLQH